jgi:hypothetical protein
MRFRAANRSRGESGRFKVRGRFGNTHKFAGPAIEKRALFDRQGTAAYVAPNARGGARTMLAPEIVTRPETTTLSATIDPTIMASSPTSN